MKFKLEKEKKKDLKYIIFENEERDESHTWQPSDGVEVFLLALVHTFILFIFFLIFFPIFGKGKKLT